VTLKVTVRAAVPRLVGALTFPVLQGLEQAARAEALKPRLNLDYQAALWNLVHALRRVARFH
jgi:hypothetical protein